MKKESTYLLLFIYFLSSCGQNSIENKKAARTVELTSDITIDSNETIHPQNNLNIVKQFVEEFLPDTIIQNGMRKMNTFPDSVVKAFKALRLNRQKQEKYLTLLYLKIYRGHLQCCYQSFELRKKPNIIGIDSIADPLLFEYNLITKQFNSKSRIE